MIFFGILVGILIMGGIIFLALDKRSNFRTRLAALGALAVMILTIIICLVIVLTDDKVPVDDSVLIVGAPPEVKDAGDNNVFSLIFSIFFLLALFAVILFLAMREHKKTKK